MKNAPDERFFEKMRGVPTREILVRMCFLRSAGKKQKFLNTKDTKVSKKKL